jgi:hypothetical protein
MAAANNPKSKDAASEKGKPKTLRTDKNQATIEHFLKK